MHVEVRQSRADWADRIVQLRILNDGDVPLTVTGATLTSTALDGTARSPEDWVRTVPPGRHRDASVPLGAPVCDGAGDPVAARAEAHVTLEDETGRRGVLTVVPEDPQGHLARIHGEDCARRAVESGVRLELRGLDVEDRDGAPIGVLTLSVTPVRGGPAVSLVAIDGTVLLRPDGAAWSLTGLGDPVGAASTVDLRLAPARCDAHAVAEDKRGTIFGVHAQVDGVDQPVFYLAADDALRGELHDYVGRYCAWPTES